jgi:hypothetical protein
MEARKFWCHYIGSDGNTPKRRSMELRPIGELVPQLEGVGSTPLWYEREEEQSYSRTYVYYWLYAQLSDKVAVTVQQRMRDVDLEVLLQTDEDIEQRATNVWTKDIERCTTEEGRKRMLENKQSWKQGEIENRDRYMQRLTLLCSFDVMLLTGNHWISNACLRAFTEAESPYYPVLKSLREQKLAERETDSKRREEERKKRLEEEAKAKIEAACKERERLIGEATKFRDGESISGEDVVELCRRCSIDIHLRTVHNLQQVIVNINGKKGTCQYYRQPKGKRRPQLDGCYEVAGKLYHHLQEHYDELVGYMKDCNKAA